MTSTTTSGYGFIVVDGERRENKNYSPYAKVQDTLYASLWGGLGWASGVFPTSSVSFLRPGNLRYVKPDDLYVGGLTSNWIKDIFGGDVYSYVLPVSSEFNFSYYYNNLSAQLSRKTFNSPVTTSYSASSRGYSFAGVSMSQVNDLYNVSNPYDGAPAAPATRIPYAAISWIDAPGTQIGNVFKHPLGREGWFNETTIIALSQGSIEVRGPYSPSESLLQHMGYQVYYTKAGGTGRPGDPANAKLTAPVQGTDGTTIAGTSQFVDDADQNLFQASWASGAAPASVLLTSTASSGTASTLVDSSLAWTTDQYSGKLVQITAGTGSGQARWITTNSTNYVFGPLQDGSDTPVSLVPSGKVVYSEQTNGAGNGSLRFNGVSNLATDARGDLGAADFTVEFWVKHDSLYNYNTYISSPRSATGFSISTSAGRKVYWYRNGSQFDATTLMNPNVWYHVAFSRSGTTVNLYINGSLENTYTDSTNYSQTRLSVGCLDTNLGEYFLGNLKDVRITKGVARYTTTTFTPPATIDHAADPFKANVTLLLQATVPQKNSVLSVSVPWNTPPASDSAYRIVNPSDYYLRINSGPSRGTYLIVSVPDSNTLNVDAYEINQPFAAGNGIDWEIVTGPVGEFFWRKKNYAVGNNSGVSCGDANNSTITSVSGLNREVSPLQNSSGAGSSIVIHDRGACWWALANNGSVPLMRWVHNSPQAFEPMHTAGKITGLSAWPFLNGAVRDMDIDDQNKLWIVGDPTNSLNVRNGRTSVIRVDPYPGGNALNPALVSSYSGNMTALPSPTNPLGANDIRGVVCDDSKAYAPNTRVWLLPGSADTNNALSYTDDYGTNWKRIHPLHSRTGTATVAPGGTSVTGTGTLFQSEFSVGDWVRFNDDTALLLSLTGQNGASAFPDTGRFSSPTFINGGASISTDQSKFGQGSLALNGVNSFVSVPWNSGLTFGSGDFTVECWAYLTATPNGTSLISEEFTGSGTISWAFGFGSSADPGSGSNLVFGYYSGSAWTRVASTTTPALNTWVHYAACRSGGTLKLFMDGVEVASGSFTPIIPTGSNLFIGRRWDTTGSKPYISGYMNDVRVVTRALYTTGFTPPTSAFPAIRSYEVAAIASDTDMTLATAHAAGVTNSTISRGGIYSQGMACVPCFNTQGSGYPFDGEADPLVSSVPCDYDSNGNLYWLSSEDVSNSKTMGRYIVRWSEGTGTSTALHYTSVQSPSGFSDRQLFSLTVQRVPTPTGCSDHQLTDAIWVSSASEGMTLIYPSFDGTHVRYRVGLADNWPVSMNMDGISSFAMNPRFILNKLTGDLSLFGKIQGWNGSAYLPYHNLLRTTSNTLGDLISLGGPYVPDTSSIPISSRSAALTAEFDEVGLGMRAAINATWRGWDGSSYSGILYGGPWLCKRWNGSDWEYGMVNYSDANIDFQKQLASPGPYVSFPLVAGAGSRRMHPSWETFDEDTNLQIRFVDKDIQLVAQEQQFLPDETSTFVCWVGQGKDNTQTAYYGIDFFNNPTVARFQSEPYKTGRNIWTQDGGVDGGYNFRASEGAALTGRPPFSRGISLPSEYTPAGGQPYPDLYNVTAQTGFGGSQYSAVLRIKPEFERTDGAITGTAISPANKKFSSAGYVFTSSDIGKSIIIEGANGNTVDNDNGQAVIMELDSSDPSGKTVITDKSFQNDRTGLRWKLMDIPAASYVAMSWEATYQNPLSNRMNVTLQSSSDRGNNWTTVKSISALRSAPAGTDILAYQSNDVIFNRFSFLRRDFTSNGSGASWMPSADSNNYGSSTILFDLRKEPENIRRRQYWKVTQADVVRDWAFLLRPVGVHILDADLKCLGVPEDCRIEDSQDELFQNTLIYDAQIVAYESTSNLTTVDIGRPDYTNTITAPGATFYEATGTDGSVTGTTFSSATASFTRLSVGKFIRLSGSAVSPSNNGYAVITSYTSPTTVTVDRSFTTSETGLTWSLASFGATDFLRPTGVGAATFFDPALSGVNLADSRFEIADVPTTDTIVFTQVSYPLAATNKSFIIERSAGTADGTLGNQIGGNPPPVSYDNQKMWSYSFTFGTLAWSRPHEFVTLQSDTSTTATTPADDDADGTTDIIVLPADLTSLGLAPGDCIEVNNSTYGRRVLEIETVSFGVPTASNTQLKVTYDELPVSSSFSWSLLRRRDQKFFYPRVLVVTKK